MPVNQPSALTQSGFGSLNNKHFLYIVPEPFKIIAADHRTKWEKETKKRRRKGEENGIIYQTTRADIPGDPFCR